MTSAERQRQQRAVAAREAGREPGRPGRPVEQPCGTLAAYRRHQRRGEAPCAACRSANAEAQANYHRNRKGPTVDPKQARIARFWAKVDKRSADECWLWTGAKGKGYGRFDYDQAHRVSWTIEHGRPIPSGSIIIHDCDVRACVNPSHLTMGDDYLNAVDRSLAGTARTRIKGRVVATRSMCGTVAAYKRHQRRGDTPCSACRSAWSAWQRDYYQQRKRTG